MSKSEQFCSGTYVTYLEVPTTIFTRTKEEGDKHVKSENLVAKLVAREDRQWAEFGHARKPITPNRLASLLRGYKIRPGTIRFGPGDKDTAKGCKHSQLVDAFERDLPARANRTVTPSQSNKIRRAQVQK